MEIRIPAMIVTAAAAFILLLLKTGRLRLPSGKLAAKKEPEEFHAAGMQSTVREHGAQTAGREEIRGTERTMLLSYTTLILKDTEHPVKKYRADLLRPVLIGRSKDNTIILEDSSVSRRHLKVFRRGALVYAENLSRMNGTMLNGKQLTEPREIMTGSRLQIGKQCFLVEID